MARRVPGWLAPVAITLLSLVIGFYRLDWPGTWPDEGYSLLEATGQADDVPSGTFRPADIWRNNTAANAVRATARFDSGNGAPYAVLLHWWIDAFGPSNLSIRIPGVLLMAGTTLVAYRLVAIASPDGVLALLAAALTAMSPILVRASKIARPNNLGVFFITCATCLLVALLRSSPHRRSHVLAVLYGITAALAVFAHYFAGFVIVGHLVMCAVLVVKRDERVQWLWRHALTAAVTMAAVAAVFFSSGVVSGMARAASTEQNRVAVERQRVAAAAAAAGSPTVTILATPENVAAGSRILLANLFLLRSAAADKPWLANRAIAAALLLVSLVTCALYASGLAWGYRKASADARLLVWLCAATVAAGVICVLLTSTLVMQTIIPFNPRSNVALVPCAAVLTALTIRGALSWRPLWRFGAIAVFAVQALVFNAVTLRQVFLLRYVEPSVRTLTGTQQTARSIKAQYRPGDVVEYELALDAAKVNVYLRNADVVQRVVTPSLQGDPVRSIVLRGAAGRNQVLWRGQQDDGALLPYQP